jgi:hypothetical protein
MFEKINNKSPDEPSNEPSYNEQQNEQHTEPYTELYNRPERGALYNWPQLKTTIINGPRMARYIDRQLNDPLSPPFKLPYYYNSYPMLAPTYNDSNYGNYGRFRKLGTLIAQSLTATDRFKFLILIGRQKQLSKNYEYYAITSDTNDRLKFFIDRNGREIYHNDIILIKELNISYEYKEDPTLSLEYEDILI